MQLPTNVPHALAGGIFVTQATSATFSRCGTFAAIYNTLKKVFPRVVAYAKFVPSFFDEWAWIVCFTDAETPTLSADEVGH